jgi:hypothetical protein
VATDQPFYTVDDSEFCKFLSYAHHPLPSLKIPHRDAVKRRIMRMNDDTVTATKQMFHVSSLNFSGDESCKRDTLTHLSEQS